MFLLSFVILNKSDSIQGMCLSQHLTGVDGSLALILLETSMAFQGNSR